MAVNEGGKSLSWRPFILVEEEGVEWVVSKIYKYIKRQNEIMHSKLLIAFSLRCEKRIDMKESFGA